MPLIDTPAQNLELLLKYMYRAELPLSNNNIQGVAASAFLLHVDGAFRWEKKLHSWCRYISHNWRQLNRAKRFLLTTLFF